MRSFETKHLSETHVEPAPDGSEIRPLVRADGASVVHCTIEPSRVSKAVVHKTVDEIWYCIQGKGRIWRRSGDREEVADMIPGTCLTIPVGTEFQFENTGTEPLCIVIATLPPWPGEDEAVRVKDRWSPK